MESIMKLNVLVLCTMATVFGSACGSGSSGNKNKEAALQVVEGKFHFIDAEGMVCGEAEDKETIREIYSAIEIEDGKCPSTLAGEAVLGGCAGGGGNFWEYGDSALSEEFKTFCTENGGRVTSASEKK